MDETGPVRRNATAAELEVAREIYQDDDIEIDDDAQVSDAHPEGCGIWIQSWVWISDEDMEARGPSDS